MAKPRLKRKYSFSFVCWEADAKMISETYVGRTTGRENASGSTTQEPVPSQRERKWILRYSERCKTRSEAMSREWYTKCDRRFRTMLRAAIRT